VTHETPHPSRQPVDGHVEPDIPATDVVTTDARVHFGRKPVCHEHLEVACGDVAEGDAA